MLDISLLLLYNGTINIEKHTNLQPSNCSPTREIVCLKTNYEIGSLFYSLDNDHN